MKTLHRPLRSSLLALSVLSLCSSMIWFGGSAQAGGPEVDCISGEVVETWPQPIPETGIPWHLVIDAAGGNFRTAIGFPGLICAGTPGLQSVLNAAATWSNVQIGVGGPGTTGGPGQLYRPFKMSSWPTGYVYHDTSLPESSDLITNDGKNVVSLLEPPSTWTPAGAAGALGLTVVTLNAAGKIIDCDVAINTRGLNTTTGVLDFSLVEYNVASATPYITHTWTPTSGPPWNPPYFDPNTGYGDLEGVLTHEFGHFAGLGHSLLDSEHVTGDAGRQTTPTMFPFAEAKSWSSSALVSFFGSCPLMLPVNTNGLLFGEPTRTLEMDDIAALGTAYPVPGFDTLGAISGKIELFDDLPTPVRAAHVYAIGVNNPRDVRVGTLSYAEGEYTIRGLPAGEYYVCAEPVDRAATWILGDASYFSNQIVPVYATIGGACGIVEQFWVPEWYDGSTEDHCDYPQRVVSVSVTGGQTMTGIDFMVDGGGSLCHYLPPTYTLSVPLRVGYTGYTPPTYRLSQRGVATFQGTNLTFYLQGDSVLNAGAPVQLRFSDKLGCNLKGPSNDQLSLLNLGSIVTVWGTLNGSAAGQINCQPISSVIASLNPSLKKIFVQAVIDPGSPYELFSNVVSLDLLD